jgi:hypothetical protein
MSEQSVPCFANDLIDLASGLPTGGTNLFFTSRKRLICCRFPAVGLPDVAWTCTRIE